MKSRDGFTLIELMVAVVILGVLAAISIPNYISMQDRAKEASVKSLAHTVQLAAEEYCTRHDGEYTDTAADLLPSLPNGVLQENAFTHARTEPQFGAIAATAGQVGIVAFAANGVNVGYTINGCGRNGEIIVQLGGQ